MARRFDIIVAGGGLVGLAIAYGLTREGLRVAVCDEGDRAHRASRGNFGLVWVQGKGADSPAYARLTAESARLWPAFAERLRGEGSIDPALAQPGGFHLCLSADELAARAAAMARLQARTRVLLRRARRARSPPAHSRNRARLRRRHPFAA
jgi:glycine/D-amino acid oxidase-like deaminating enzyme